MFPGISMWSFAKEAFSGEMNIQGFIRYAGQNGYAAVELLDSFQNGADADLEAAKDLAETLGLKIACYSIANDFANPDESIRKKQVEYVRKGIETASRLGAPILRVFGGSVHEGVNYKTALPWIVEGFCACKALAAEKNITMAMENHGALSGSAHQVLEIIQAVDSPYFGATADLGNFLLVDEEPLEAVRSLLKFVRHVHCKDLRPAPQGETQIFRSIAGRRYIGCAIGEGTVEVGKILLLLKENKYSGMVSIEYEGTEPAPDAIARSKAYIDKYL